MTNSVGIPYTLPLANLTSRSREAEVNWGVHRLVMKRPLPKRSRLGNFRPSDSQPNG